MDRLEKIVHVMDLIKNPFMLRMILEILPRVALTTTQITRVELYDDFVDLHYGNEQKRLIEQRSRGKMDSDRLAVFRDMEGPNFIDLGIDFSKRLADTIFTEGKGVNSVEYWSVSDKKSWKQQFFGSDPKTQLLMEASQLIRRTSAPDSQEQIRGKSRLTGRRDAFRFSHMSILEYFYALSIYDPREDLRLLDSAGSLPFAASSPSLADHPLGRRSLVTEPTILQFLADRAKYDVDFKVRLRALVELSKTDASVSCAASNAITILIRAGERFNGADLRGIRVPGADLSCGDFDSALLQGADLRNTVLRNVWLHQANLSNSRMEGVSFGEYPYLYMDYVLCFVFSPDGRHLTFGLYDGLIEVYDTSTWSKVFFPTHTGGDAGVTHSLSSAQLTTGSDDKTIRGKDVITGALVSSLSGHISEVTSIAYSPSGHHIASGSSDKTVRLWDAKTGALVSTLRGHIKWVSSVAYSPSGHQIATGSGDETVRLWNAKTGALVSTLSGHTSGITSVVYSPSGHQITSGSKDGTVRLWDAQTGALVSTLRGHTDRVTSVAYSPSGHQITSGSYGGTVRLWDLKTGALASSLSGHTASVTFAVYSAARSP